MKDYSDFNTLNWKGRVVQRVVALIITGLSLSLGAASMFVFLSKTHFLSDIVELLWAVLLGLILFTH